MRSLANRLIQQHGLKFWTFDFNNRTTCLGLCDYANQKIYYSRVYLTLDVEQITDIILHEIAHALTPGSGHGYLWKEKCVQIGCRPERVVSVERQGECRYKAVCRRCGTVYRRSRITQSRAYSCPKCCKRFNPEFVLTFEKTKS